MYAPDNSSATLHAKLATNALQNAGDSKFTDGPALAAEPGTLDCGAVNRALGVPELAR